MKSLQNYNLQIPLSFVLPSPSFIIFNLFFIDFAVYLVYFNKLNYSFVLFKFYVKIIKNPTYSKQWRDFFYQRSRHL